MLKFVIHVLTINTFPLKVNDGKAPPPDISVTPFLNWDKQDLHEQVRTSLTRVGLDHSSIVKTTPSTPMSRLSFFVHFKV